MLCKKRQMNVVFQLLSGRPACCYALALTTPLSKADAPCRSSVHKSDVPPLDSAAVHRCYCLPNHRLHVADMLLPYFCTEALAHNIFSTCMLVCSVGHTQQSCLCRPEDSCQRQAIIYRITTKTYVMFMYYITFCDYELLTVCVQLQFFRTEELVQLRATCINMVLGTDMKKHFDIVSRFQV